MHRTFIATLLLGMSIGPALAQDIRGMENCGAEKQMDRRTGYLQANVEFLQQEMVKLKRNSQAQLAAAQARAQADSASLRAALSKLEAELAQIKAKADSTKADSTKPDSATKK